MKRPQPVFLARRGYRLRRATDAARFLPIAGIVLLLIPLLWGGGATRSAIIYLFSVWIVLIAAAFGLSFSLRRAAQQDPDSETPAED